MLEPTRPDPIAAALLLEGISDRVQALTELFRETNAKGKRFPEWREYQILKFVKFIGLYANDLGVTYRAGRRDALAQAARNLLELMIWTIYCTASEENAKRFFDDAARDLREVMETLQKLYTHANNEPQQKIGDILADMKARAPQYNIPDLDESYVRVSKAAATIGKGPVFGHFYKIVSKLAHPTSLTLNLKGSLQELRDSVYGMGAKLADACLNEVEKAIRTEYPKF